MNKFIFRMIHIQGLDFVLKNGCWAETSGVHDPDFVQIGDTGVISRRRETHISLGVQTGVVADYVPFYFSGHSPMLYRIITGYGVKQLSQKDIVFLVVRLERVFSNKQLTWCFTNGNAANCITKFYSRETELNLLDWETINRTIWKNTEEDPDCKRRKQSEFLIREHVPIDLIEYILTFSDDVKKKVEDMLSMNGLERIKVYVDYKFEYYYK